MKKTIIGRSAAIFTIFFLIGVFLTPVPGFSGDYGMKKHGKGFGKGFHGKNRSILGFWKNPEMVETLGLTAEQVERLKEADFDSRERANDLRAKMESLALGLEKQFSEDVVDEVQVKNTAEKMSEVRGEMFMRFVDDRLTVSQILNPEQREKIRAEFMERRGNRKCFRKQMSFHNYGKQGRM